MKEKLAHAGEGGVCTPTSFHYIYGGSQKHKEMSSILVDQ